MGIIEWVFCIIGGYIMFVIYQKNKQKCKGSLKFLALFYFGMIISLSLLLNIPFFISMIF